MHIPFRFRSEWSVVTAIERLRHIRRAFTTLINLTYILSLNFRLETILENSKESNVAYVTQNSGDVGINLSTQLLPAPAKGVVL
jgi:hypothetical protein